MIWNRYQYWATELSKTTNYSEKRGAAGKFLLPMRLEAEPYSYFILKFQVI